MNIPSLRWSSSAAAVVAAAAAQQTIAGLLVAVGSVRSSAGAAGAAAEEDDAVHKDQPAAFRPAMEAAAVAVGSTQTDPALDFDLDPADLHPGSDSEQMREHTAAGAVVVG